MEREHVIMGLANANSPMSWDFNMLGSAKVYAENNQIMLITPFILGGAMAPVTVAAQATQTLAEALAGMAFCQIVRPGAPVIFGSFASSMSMQSGAPTFGTPEPQLVLFVLAALSRRLGVPFRSGGNFTASKLPDYQAAYESAISYMATMQAGVNFNLHTAGWLEGGLAIGYEKFILDEDQASMTAAYIGGVDVTDNGYALDAMLAGGPGQHFLGSPHTLANFENAFWRSELSNNDSFEQWEIDGGLDAAQRANAPLEAAPRRVRAAAARRRDPRRTRRLDGSAQGELPRLGRLARRSAPGARRQAIARSADVTADRLWSERRTSERSRVDRPGSGPNDARTSRSPDHRVAGSSFGRPPFRAEGSDVSDRADQRIARLTSGSGGGSSSSDDSGSSSSAGATDVKVTSSPWATACWALRCSRPSSSSGMWQLMRWPGATSTSGGSVTSQTPGMIRWQRVWKTQPTADSPDSGSRPRAGSEPSPRLDVRDGRQQRLRVRVVRPTEDRLRIRRPP